MLADEAGEPEAQRRVAAEIALRVRAMRAMAEHADLRLLAFLLDMVARAAEEDRLRAAIGTPAAGSQPLH